MALTTTRFKAGSAVARLVVLLGSTGLGGSTGAVAVCVLANRSPVSVTCQVDEVQLQLNPGDCRPIPLLAPVQMRYTAAGRQSESRIEPLCIYYFGGLPRGGIELGQIALTLEPTAESNAAARPAAPAGRSKPPANVIIPVKLFFDETPGISAAQWDSSLRRRFDEVSRIFAGHCFVEFQIAAVEPWHLADEVTNFETALSQFERVTSPGAARLAIGFTGKVRTFEDRHLGGTRGPLHTHLLVRERVTRNSEKERVELLVHELGHFLGAVHSPEPNSVMRPLLGNVRTWTAASGIGFDPPNTLVMCLVSDQLRRQPAARFADFDPRGKRLLRGVYALLAEAAVKDDLSAIRFRQQLEEPTGVRYLLGEPRRP